MGELTGYLQAAFARHCPAGWRCRQEVPVLAPELAQLLGYAPRADVLLERPDGSRLWIEFEISRADPVANHTKFATAHLLLNAGRTRRRNWPQRSRAGWQHSQQVSASTATGRCF